MSLASKLQGVHVKVNRRLDFQDKVLIFYKTEVTSGGIGEQNTETVTSTTVDGARVTPVSVRNTAPYGPYVLGDLQMFIPKSLLAESFIDGAWLTYGGVRHTIVAWGPAPVEGTPAVMGGEVINWRVIARKREA